MIIRHSAPERRPFAFGGYRSGGVWPMPWLGSDLLNVLLFRGCARGPWVPLRRNLGLMTGITASFELNPS